MIVNEIFEWLGQADVSRATHSIEETFYIATDLGETRTENQDRVAVLHLASKTHRFWCACLCDGMGGMPDGARAASFAVAAFFSSLITNRRMPTEKRLEIAANAASVLVAEQTAGGGSTLSAVCFENDSVFTVNVGDSRIFNVASNGEIERLTTDDTMEEAYGAEGRGLLQYIGMRSGLSPHVAKLQGNNTHLIITSDGAHLLGEAILSSLWRNANQPDLFAARVLDLANWMGGVDNATVVVAQASKRSNSSAYRSSPDVSVWSPRGRLKISWGSYSQSETATPVPTAARVVDPLGIESASPKKNDQGPKRSVATTKKTKRRKLKKDQVEIGFSDEGSNE